MQVLQRPCAAPLCRPKTARHVSRCRKIAQPTASLQEIIRTRGLVVPTSIAQDVATLTGATAVAAALYAVLTRRKPSGIKDKLILASSSAIFWYAGRYLFFGVEWGTASQIWLLDKLSPIAAAGQWKPCPGDNPALCDLPSIPWAQAPEALDGVSHAQANNLHYAPLMHTVQTFVEQHPVVLTVHLGFIVVSGLLWPLQIWGPFRHENYARHKLIGKFAMGSLMGTYVTASVIAMGHLSSNEWAEKATGLAFAANISLSVYSLVMGVIAAKQKDIPTHRRHVIRMIGLAYGVFPFKYLWLTLLSTTDVISGEWTYAVSIWLACITGVLVTEKAFLGALPNQDAAKSKQQSV